jgi:hypothetical protein
MYVQNAYVDEFPQVYKKYHTAFISSLQGEEKKLQELLNNKI